jgi:2-iminobutanoate/2-iminopropanoate deaminase
MLILSVPEKRPRSHPVRLLRFRRATGCPAAFSSCIPFLDEEANLMQTEVKRTHIQTPGAPAAIGPYSQAIVANGFVFCSGQAAIDPQTNTLVEGDIRVQTHRVMQNLDAVLRAAGSGLHNMVQTTVYLAHFNDFPAMNEVYSEYFEDSPPARSTIGVGSLPRGMLVQIGCIAIVPGSVSSISVIEAKESTSSFNLDFDSDI